MAGVTKFPNRLALRECTILPKGLLELTVAVSCNVPEGVVLGVDSAVTVSSDQGGALKVFEHGEKLFPLVEGLPCGLATYGLASIGDRSLSSFIHEFRTKYGSSKLFSISLPKTVELLRDFLMKAYIAEIVPQLEKEKGIDFEEIPEGDRPGFGVLIGGFSWGEPLSEVWNIVIPNHSEKDTSQLVNGRGKFAADWFATVDPIERYFWGIDNQLLVPIIKYTQKLLKRDLTGDELKELYLTLLQRRYSIPYSAMPIWDAALHVKYLVELVIDHYRYALGMPVVGGSANVGMIRYDSDEFHILSREDFENG